VSLAASTDGRSWQVITAGADTGADGVLTFVTRPKRTTYLRLTTSVASGSGWSVTRAPVLRVKVTRAAATLSITVEKGRPARISGRLITTIAPQGVAHRSVSLQYKQAGRKEWQTLRSLITDRTGRVSTPVKSIRGRYYRWRFAGTTSELPDLSSAAHLR
jgi:hypothetical protein